MQQPVLTHGTRIITDEFVQRKGKGLNGKRKRVDAMISLIHPSRLRKANGVIDAIGSRGRRDSCHFHFLKSSSSPFYLLIPLWFTVSSISEGLV